MPAVRQQEWHRQNANDGIGKGQQINHPRHFPRWKPVTISTCWRKDYWSAMTPPKSIWTLVATAIMPIGLYANLNARSTVRWLLYVQSQLRPQPMFSKWWLRSQILKRRWAHVLASFAQDKASTKFQMSWHFEQFLQNAIQQGLHVHYPSFMVAVSKEEASQIPYWIGTKWATNYSIPFMVQHQLLLL